MSPLERFYMSLFFKGSHLIASEWEVLPVTPSSARAFISAHHYSKGSSLTGVYYHGLFRRGMSELMGVAHRLPPTKPAAMSVNADNWRRVLSLSRLAIHPSCPTNAASFLLARSIRIIRQQSKWRSLVTYADESQGHRGQIYRATNWQYAGTGSPSPRWVDPATGRQVATLSTKTRTKQQMLDLGYELVGRFLKHKFVMHV